MKRVLRFKLKKTPSDVDRVLRYVVRTAYRSASGYRQILDEAGVSPDCVRGIGDLPRLPIVDKETLFRRFSLDEALHRRANPDRCVRVGTSGSTGLPLNVFMSKGEAFFRRALVLAAWRRIAPFRVPLTVGDVGSWVESEDVVVERRGALGRIVRISIGSPVERQVELLLEHRPQVLSGYPTALHILAEGLLDASRRVPFLRLVATRGEVLHEETRRALETAFRCRVADFYNSEEIGNMAWECPDDPASLHVNTDGCVLEIVDERGEPVAVGTEGRVIATNLFNCTMPLIRYDLHDRGCLLDSKETRCACGSSSPRMAVLQGRDDDCVWLPDGRTVSPRLVATAVNRAFSGLSPLGGFDRHFRGFQVVQDALDHVTVRIIPESDRTVDFRSVIDPALRRIHPDLHCSVEVVDALPHEPSGKFRKVIRRIGRDEAAS